MAQNMSELEKNLPADVGDKVWVDVLEAVDKTYAELVAYQEELEARNAELTVMRGFLGSIMGSISDYLVVAGKDGRIEDASVSFCTATGLPADALQGQPIENFFKGDEHDKLLSALSRAATDRVVHTAEAILDTPGGPEPVELRIAPRLDRRRKPTGVILTARPMGELRRAYSELETGHEQLKQTQMQLVRNEKLASLGRLLAGVAHELNNPISFVYANTHSLEKYLDRFEAYFEKVQSGASREELIGLRQDLKLERDLKNLRVAIEGARDGSERVRSIVEDLRRLSAEGSGDVEAFDLVEVSRIAADWVKRGSKSDLTITLEGAAECRALGRPGHIQQVVMNLVQNAVDAMVGQADPEVRLRLSQSNGHAVLEVCDNGPGISEDLALKIFDPFYTTKDVGKGTGLGLAISAKIAEEHGGSLTHVPSEAGACFRLELRADETR